MASTPQAARDGLSGDANTTPLLFRSDFCDFGDFGRSARSESGSRSRSSRGSSEVDSDVEDAIYAHMYFEELPGSGETARKSGDVVQDKEKVIEEGNGLSISLTVDKTKSKVKKKRKKKKKKAKSGHDDKATPPQTNGEREIPSDDVIENGNDVIAPGVRESAKSSKDSIVIDLTNSDPEPGEERKAGQGSRTNDVIIISSDSERETAKVKSSIAPSDVVESDSVSSASEDGDSSEGGEGGEALDMDLSDDEGREATQVFDDPWHVSLKDKLGREEYERCYGNSSGLKSSKNQTAKCGNCKQRYHSARNCPWPKRHQVCFLCGEADHLSSRCPHDLCTFCYHPKHRGRSCSAPWSSPKTQCLRCFMTGHHAAICPDLWRQFHNTTYSSDELYMIVGTKQRKDDHVYCFNCSTPGHYGFECTRTLPRGWPQTHLLLIANYDVNAWPPPQLSQMRERYGIDTSRTDTGSRGEGQGEVDVGGASSRRRSRGRRGKRKRVEEEEEYEREAEAYPSLPKRHTSSAIERSMSFDSGVVMSRGASLLGTPPTVGNYNIPRTSSLLGTPATPTGLNAPPTKSLSSQSERNHFHVSSVDYHHRRDSEPAVPTKRQRLSSHNDFPREPMLTTPPLYNNQSRYHHGNHQDDRPHSSRQHYDDGNSTHNQYMTGRHHDNTDARYLIEHRRMSYPERGVSYEQTPPLPHQRRMSDHIELRGGARTAPMGYHDNRQRNLSNDEHAVNSRGFRGQTHLHNYRH